MKRTKKNAGGAVLIWRSIRNHPSWFTNEGRPAMPFEAWLDLILLASYQDEDVNDRGESVHLKRGQVLACERYLATRWTWSRGKVRRWAKAAQSRGEIQRNPARRRTILTLCNYEYWQAFRTTGSTTGSTTDRPESKSEEYPERRDGVSGWTEGERAAVRNLVDQAKGK